MPEDINLLGHWNLHHTILTDWGRGRGKKEKNSESVIPIQFTSTIM
jgi:hypothetical protein